MNTETQMLIQGLTVFGAGLVSLIGAYVGVRVALAEIKATQANHARDIADYDERIKYLERVDRRHV